MIQPAHKLHNRSSFTEYPDDKWEPHAVTFFHRSPWLRFHWLRFHLLRECGLAERMITATRRWLRQNRAAFAAGFGVIGVGYFAGQYVLSKITEARERIAGDRIAKEKYKFTNSLHNGC